MRKLSGIRIKPAPRHKKCRPTASDIRTEYIYHPKNLACDADDFDADAYMDALMHRRKWILEKKPLQKPESRTVFKVMLDAAENCCHRSAVIRNTILAGFIDSLDGRKMR